MNENLIAVVLVAVPFIIYETWTTIKDIEKDKGSFFYNIYPFYALLCMMIIAYPGNLY